MRGIRSMYVDSSASFKVKGGKREQFRIDSGVRSGCIMSLWLFNVHMDGVMKEVKMGMGESGDSLAFYMQMAWFYVASWRRT